MQGLSPNLRSYCDARWYETTQACEWIENAIEWGLSPYQLCENNRYLAPLCGDPRCKALVERAKEQSRAFET